MMEFATGTKGRPTRTLERKPRRYFATNELRGKNPARSVPSGRNEQSISTQHRFNFAAKATLQGHGDTGKTRLTERSRYNATQ